MGAGSVEDYFTVAYGYKLAGGSGTLRLVRRTGLQILAGNSPKQITGKVVAEYWYNALSHRIAERHDRNDDGEADADDPTFHAIHDGRWRRVGTVRSEAGVMDDEPKELWAHHAAGLAGEGGSSYIDSVIMRDRDTATDWEEEASGVLGQRVYPLRNWRADVSVVVNHDGSRVLEWVKYSAYGVPTLLAAFGMGFNIATARLGTVTKVWSTRAGDPEWQGVEIDFEALIRHGSFRTPLLTRPKQSAAESGTEVTVEKLKPDHANWFARQNNRTKLQRDLSKSYSAMLRSDGVPISFRLDLNTTPIVGRQHCIWGGPGSTARQVEHSRYGVIEAYQRIDNRLSDRAYCLRCWHWAPARGNVCPACGESDQLVDRQRHVRGWIGIQRYLSENEYGIDFLRNGRKIEAGNVDLFSWTDGDNRQEEYPIDDPRHRGRIVGEIHLDHCRVTYMKDRFDRADPAWEEMVRIVRGEGPLQPDKAREAGISENHSPLFKLFQAFRRSSPKPKVAGCYKKLFIVPDNERASEMAKQFHAGNAEYLSDEKWWELADEADRELLTPPIPGGGPGTGPGGIPGLPGEDPAPPPGGGRDEPPPEPPPAPPRPLQRTLIPSLTREYKEAHTERRYEVRGFRVESTDDALQPPGTPWALQRLTTGGFEFYVDSEHEVFRSATLTPLDALLTELAFLAYDFTRGGASAVPFSNILAGLRAEYAGSLALDPVTLSADANAAILAVAKSIVGKLDPAESQALFYELYPAEQEAIQRRMVARQARNPQQVITDGRFLEFAPPKTVLRFFETHPELFLDGSYWDDQYESLQFPSAAATDEARAVVVRHYAELLSAAVWLTEMDPEDLGTASRSRLLRAALAIDLLAPARAEEADR